MPAGRWPLATALWLCLLLAPSLVTAVAIEDFLQRHWARPLAAQGVPPADFDPLSAQLAPQACGTCHAAQYADWQASLHAAALGPGLLGQLRDYAADDRAGHQECLRCHAPLAEQADDLAAELGGMPPPNGGLHQQGLVCAACHVRGHVRHGPARRDGSGPAPGQVLPHAGWQVSEAFGDARFCAACHQFEADGYALEGKLLENTYAEWQASRHAREGRSCQACHMPDRRHLWRGIHDPETVRNGVTVEPLPLRVDAGELSGGLRVRNTGTGHHFPTYVTPRVVFTAVQLDANGSAIEGTAQELWIARAVTLDLAEELFDSRIPADGELELVYALPRAANATALQLQLRVEPDAFYTDFYRARLEAGDGAGRAELEQALAASLASQFTLYATRLPLPGG